METLLHLKEFITRRIVSLPLTSTFYLKRRAYTFTMDEKTLRGKVQQVGHRVDVNIANNHPVSLATIRELEFLIHEIRKRNIALDESLIWALGLYTIAKHKLHRQYIQGLKKARQEAESVIGEKEVVALFKQRRSIRKWTQEPVDVKHIEDIIDVSKWAPSSCNRQLWKTLLINRPKDKEFLTRYFSNTFWLSAPLLIVVLMDAEIYCSHEKHYAYLDAGGFIQNLLLMLDHQGYGACWIGFARWDTLGNIHTEPALCERFYEYFHLKKGLIPVSMIAVGRPDRKPKLPPRQDISTIVIKDFIE
ncbi:MAG: nitroreductase family protein [bacterium]